MSLLRTLGAGKGDVASDRCHDDRSEYYQRKYRRIPSTAGCSGRKSRATAGVQVLNPTGDRRIYRATTTIQLGTKSYHDTRNKALIAVESTVGMMGDNALTTYFDEFYNSWYELSMHRTRRSVSQPTTEPSKSPTPSAEV